VVLPANSAEDEQEWMLHLMGRSLPLRLALQPASSNTTGPTGQARIHVAADGTFSFGSHRTASAEELHQLLLATHQRDDLAVVLISADDDAAFGNVAAAMNACERARIDSMLLCGSSRSRPAVDRELDADTGKRAGRRGSH
jgi:biopolymer transport protein ExbD